MSLPSRQHTPTLRRIEEAFRQVFPSDPHGVHVQMPLALRPYSAQSDGAHVEGTLDHSVDEHPSKTGFMMKVADASLNFGRTRKTALYASAGIPDYRIDNLFDHGLEVHYQPAGNAYAKRQVLAFYEQIVSLARPAAFIDAARLFLTSRI